MRERDHDHRPEPDPAVDVWVDPRIHLGVLAGQAPPQTDRQAGEAARCGKPQSDLRCCRTRRGPVHEVVAVEDLDDRAARGGQLLRLLEDDADDGAGGEVRRGDGPLGLHDGREEGHLIAVAAVGLGGSERGARPLVLDASACCALAHWRAPPRRR